MIREILLNSVLAIFSMYIVFDYYRIFFEVRKSGKKNNIIVCLYCVCQVFRLAALVFVPFGFQLLFNMIFVVLISQFFLGNIQEKIFFAINYNNISILTEYLVGILFLIFGLQIVEFGKLCFLISKFILYIIVKVLKCFFQHTIGSMLSWKDNAMITVLSAGSMFFTYYLFIFSHKDVAKMEILFSLFVCFFILITNIVYYFIYIKLVDSTELRHKNSIYQMEIDLYNEHIKEKENSMLEFRKSIHDIKHKLIFLHESLKEKKYDELEKYIVEWIDLKTLEGDSIAHSNNYLIDALVNYKYETAKQYGIEFSAKLDIPISFPMANSDLCVILGNALDNAIEANVNKNVMNPYINLKMKYTQNNLIIILENSFDGYVEMDRKGNVLTRKQDTKNHGIGISSIKKALFDYNGFMNIEIENKKYKLTIIMYPKC